MRATKTLLRSPLIKFLGKRAIPTSVDHTPRAHPQSPNGILPASFSAVKESLVSAIRKSSIQPKDGEFFLRTQLPARFQYSQLDDAEIDSINSGCALI